MGGQRHVFGASGMGCDVLTLAFCDCWECDAGGAKGLEATWCSDSLLSRLGLAEVMPGFSRSPAPGLVCLPSKMLLDMLLPGVLPACHG